jgi:hypothetical protein
MNSDGSRNLAPSLLYELLPEAGALGKVSAGVRVARAHLKGVVQDNGLATSYGPECAGRTYSRDDVDSVLDAGRCG